MGVNILIAVAIVVDVLCLIVCIGAVVKDIKRWGKILSVSVEYEDEDEPEEPVASAVCFEKPNKRHETKNRIIPFAQ